MQLEMKNEKHLVQTSDKKAQSEFSNYKELQAIVEKYQQRKVAEDVKAIQELGGTNQLTNNLQSHPINGITKESLPKRIAVFGTNSQKPESKFSVFCDYLKDPTIILLLIAFFVLLMICFVPEAEHPTSKIIESIIILFVAMLILVIRLGNYLPSTKKIKKLDQIQNAQFGITAIRDGLKLQLDQREIHIGEIIELKPEMEIPSNCLLIKSDGLISDEAAVTGDSAHMEKETHEICHTKFELIKTQKEIQYIKVNDVPSSILLAGAKIVSGTGLAMVITLPKFVSSGAANQNKKEEEGQVIYPKLAKIQIALIIIGILFSIICIFSVLFRALADFNKKDKWTSKETLLVLKGLLSTIAVLLAVLPHILQFGVTLTLSFFVKKAMMDMLLVRKLQVGENLAKVNIICTENSGMLIQNKKFLAYFWNNGTTQVFNFVNEKYTQLEEFIGSNCRDFFVQILTCNFNPNMEETTSNPNEFSILKFLAEMKVDIAQIIGKTPPRICNPHTFVRKAISTVIESDGKIMVLLRGDAEIVTSSCNSLHDMKTGEIKNIEEEKRTEIGQVITEYQQKGIVTAIAIAYKFIDSLEEYNNSKLTGSGLLEIETSNFTLVGVCGIEDRINLEARSGIKSCKEAGVSVKVLTSDSKSDAVQSAKILKILDNEKETSTLPYEILEGEEFIKLIGGVVSKTQKNENQVETKIDTIQNQEMFDRIWPNLKVLAKAR